MHFRDLEYLTTTLDVEKVRKFLKELEKRELGDRGIAGVEHIDGAQAMLM